MVVRFWSARTTPAQAQVYLQHFADEVLPALRKFTGYLSSSVLERSTESAVEILVLTVWQSLSAIDAFAGPDREAAVVAPQAAALLIDYDRRVHHFEVAAADNLSFG
jgi:heme-degrading monooxygenase HmoA